MSNFHPWQLGTALLTALSWTASTVLPFVPSAPAFAQATFSDVSSTYWAKDFIAAQVPEAQVPQTPVPEAPIQDTTVRIPSGTRLPVQYDAAERILVAPNEPAPVPLTLTIARNIVAANRSVLIPAGSQVVGELVTIEDRTTDLVGQPLPEPQPASAQFVAKQVILPNGQRLSIRATSEMITKKEVISKRPISRDRRIIGSTALGVAAAAAVTAITGGTLTLGGIILGAGTGVGVNLLGLFRNRDVIELILINPNTDLTLTLNADMVVPPK
jgi:hypothetical protein